MRRDVASTDLLAPAAAPHAPFARTVAGPAAAEPLLAIDARSTWDSTRRKDSEKRSDSDVGSDAALCLSGVPPPAHRRSLGRRRAAPGQPGVGPEWSSQSRSLRPVPRFRPCQSSDRHQPRPSPVGVVCGAALWSVCLGPPGRYGRCPQLPPTPGHGRSCWRSHRLWRVAYQEAARAVASEAEIEAMARAGCWVVATFSILFRPDGIELGDRDNPAVQEKVRWARETVAT